MTDIFDATILCKKCNVKMKPGIVNRGGFELRAVVCSKCGDKIIHPADLNSSEQMKDLKDKRFEVKLRTVGNSHAISIPKEIVDFMTERHRDMKQQMDEMVSLAFEDFDTLRLSFGEDMFDEDEDEERNERKDNVQETREEFSSPDGRIKGFRIKRVRRS
ncbi:MAG: hypothetical protein WCK90_00160 [archaeon]